MPLASSIMQFATIRRAAGCFTWLACVSLNFGQPVAPIQPRVGEEEPVKLEPVQVTASNDDEDYDATGLGSVEQQLRDEPFSNDLIDVRDYSLDMDDAGLAADLSHVVEPSPADQIAGEDRLSLRGFPTPTLRNGFIQVGIPETLNTGQTIVIQGALVPVLGRAAPGGIQNFLTARPRTNAQTRINLLAGSLDRFSAKVESGGPLVPKKAWYRGAGEFSGREGPQEFATEEVIAVSAGVTWKHNKTASTLFSVDYRAIDALAAPGIPEFRPAGAARIAGPYLPLAAFNANGPEAGVRRRSAIVGLQYDGQPTKSLAVRAGFEAWARDLEQDRFTTSVLDLETGFFEGTREPRHLEQPQHAVAAHLEATARFRRGKAEHKLMASASQTWGRYLREERALSVADRNALPLSVRRFDPSLPDYFLPPFSPALYQRVLSDREEFARYGSVELSDRAAFRRGHIVLTAGLRHDSVELEVEDRRPGATMPLTNDRTAQLSYHAGVNWRPVQSKMLLFATTSTAFDPSTPVDARTGRIQDNETTIGYESGARGRALAGKLDYSMSGFLLLNQHISRRNPLYNDPVADANQTQPQLVASGEERFSGGRVELRWQASKAVSLNMKANYTRAITTASPDLPQEVGLPLSRLPAFTAQANLRYRPAPAGWFGSAVWQYLDGFVANYEDARRDFLSYPGYGIAHANLGYAWKKKQRTMELEAGLRNVFDRDLLRSNARLGAERELTVNARLIF